MPERRSLPTVIAAAFFLLCSAAPAWADAASYIRTLFDATVTAPPAQSTADADCQRYAALARFAAGRHWRQYDASDRASFGRSFCTLAHEALRRLKQLYPDLSLTLLESHPGPRDMTWVRSKTRAGGKDWPVDWLVGDPEGTPYLADIRILGVSLAIMLRGLAAGIPESEPAEIIKPWRQALDLALPE
jgi:hypothetical protein